MPIPRFVRRLSYRPWFIGVVRKLGLREPARRLYHRLASPRQGILRIERGGLAASFITQTPEQLRAVEAGSMESSLDFLARWLQPADTVYDVGSHVGLYSVLLAKVVGEKGMVIAFEPHHETYEQLLENVRLNGLTNIRSFEKAIGERNCEEKLYIGEVIANYSLLAGAIAGPFDGDIPYQLVQVVQGDEFAEAERLPVPTAVKIDVEGFEYAVIRGFSRTLSDPRCRMVCCEIHPKFLPPDVKAADISRLLKSLGYDRIEAEPRDEPYHLLGYKD